MSVLILEDRELQRGLYETQFASWGPPLHLCVCKSGYQALVEVGTRRPDVQLADVVMEGIDGYEGVSNLLNQAWSDTMEIAIPTSLGVAELETRGGSPEGVRYFLKPIDLSSPAKIDIV